MALVSVILPFHRGGLLLQNAIQSIVNQTFIDWELILINNNADSKAANISDKFTQKDSRIRVIHEPRQGVAFAANSGLSAAIGKYVARMDSDDISHPERLQKQVNFLENNPETEVIATQTSFNSTIEQNEGFRLFTEWQNNIITPQQHYLYRFVESPVANPTVMFHRTLIQDFGLNRTDDIPEDYELFLRWFDNGIRFQKITDKLVQWNDHPTRLTRTHNNYSETAFLKVKCIYLAKWLKQNLSPNTQIIICGASKNSQQKVEILKKQSINIQHFTDVKERNIKYGSFIPLNEAVLQKDTFFLSFISKRGVRESIENYFGNNGLINGKDFLLAG